MTVSAKVKQTMATLKVATSTMKIYANQSQKEEIKQSFKEAIKSTEEIIENLDKRIGRLELEEPQYKGY